MKRMSLFLILGLLTVPCLWADDLKPPVPAADNSDLLPPPVDITQLTPLPMPGDTKSGASQAPPPAASAPAPIATPVPEKTETKKKATKPAPAAEASAPPAAAEATSDISLGAFANYFPTAKGTKWTYEYLKAEAGSAAKKTRTVECVGLEAISGGAVATFQVTEDGQTSQEKYTLSNNQVEHTASGDQTFSGDFVYKLPEAGGSANWSVTEPNGTEHKSKAFFGKGQVYKKVYPDCVIVSEKIGSGAKPSATIFYYYAKGKGLVSMEVYGKSLKQMAFTKSFALVSGPTAH